jgi:hypothetical protein
LKLASELVVGTLPIHSLFLPAPKCVLVLTDQMRTQKPRSKFVPKMYPSSGDGAFLAFLATNEINNLRIISTPQ